MYNCLLNELNKSELDDFLQNQIKNHLNFILNINTHTILNMYKPTATLISPNLVCYNIPKSPNLNRVGATSALVSLTIYCVAGLKILNNSKVGDKSEFKSDSFFGLDTIRAFIQRFSPDEVVFSNDIHSFDLINHSWSKLACNSDIVPCPRIYCSMNILKNKLYLYGGLNDNLEVLNDFWQFDLQTQTWKLLKDFSINGDSKILASIIYINNTVTFLPKSYENYSKYEWEDSIIISNGVDRNGKPSNSIICYVLAYDEVIHTDIKLPRMNENITKNILISYPEKTTSILRDSCLYFTVCDGKAFTYSLVNSDIPQFIETELPHNEIILSLVKTKIFALINTNIIITGFKDGKIHVFLFNLRTKVLSNLSTVCELHPGNYHIAYNVFLWRNHSKLILFGYNLEDNEKEFEAPILQKYEGIIFFDLAYTNLTKFSILNDLKNHLNSETAKTHFKNACKQKLLDASMDEEDATIDAEFPLLVCQKLDSAAAAANETNEKSRLSVTSKGAGADNNNSASVSGPSAKDSGFMKTSSDFESYVNYLVPESNLNLASTVYSFFNNSAIALGRNFFQRFSQTGNIGHLTDFRFISADEKVICFPMNILLKRWGPHFLYILADAYLKNIEMVMANMDDKPTTTNTASNSSHGSENYNNSTSTTADRKILPKKSIVSSIATFTMHRNSVSDYSSSRNSAFFDNLLHRRSSLVMDGTTPSNNLKSPVTYYLLSNNILNSSASSALTSNAGSSRRASAQNNSQVQHQNQNQQQQQRRALQTIEGIGGLSSMDDTHVRHTPIQASRRLSTPAVFNKTAAKNGAYSHSHPHASGSPAANGSVVGGRFSYGTVSSSHSGTSGSRNKFQDSSIITDFKNLNSKIIFNSPFENNKKISVSTSTSNNSNNQLDEQSTNKTVTEEQASTPILADTSVGNGLSNQLPTGAGANASHYTDFLNLPSSRKNSVISNASSLFSSNSSNNNNHTTILNTPAVAASALHGNSSSSHSVNENNAGQDKAGSASPQLLAASGAANLDSALQQSADRQQSITSIMDKFSSTKQQILSVPEQTSMPNFSAPLGSPPLINPTSSLSQSQFAYGNNIPVPRTTRIGSVASASSNLSSELLSSSSLSPSHQAPRSFHNISEYQTYPFGDTVTTVFDRSQYQSENEMVSPKTRTRNTFDNNTSNKDDDDKNMNNEPIENMHTFQESNFADRTNAEYSQYKDNYGLQNSTRIPKSSRDTNPDTISDKLSHKTPEENEVFNIISETLEEYAKYYDFIDSENSPKDEGSKKATSTGYDTDQTPANDSTASFLKKQFLLEPLLIPRFMYLPVQSDTVKVMCEFFLTGKLNKHTPVATVLVELYMLSKFYHIPLLHNACSEVLYAIFSKIENFVVTYLDFLDCQLEDMIKDVRIDTEKAGAMDENKLKESKEKLKKLEYLKRYYDKVIAPFGKYIRSTHGSDSFYIPIAKEFAKYNFILRKYSNNVKFDEFWSTDLCEFISKKKSLYTEKLIVDDEYSEYEFDCDELEDLMFNCSLGKDPRFGITDNVLSLTFEEVFKSTFIRKTNNLSHKLPGKNSKNPKLMKIEDVFDSSEPPPIEIISLIYQSTVLLGDTKFMLRCLHLLKTHKIVQEFKKPVETSLRENLIAELRMEEKILEEQKERDDQLKLKQSMKAAEQRKKEKLRVEEFEKVKVEQERLKEEQRLRKLRRREQHHRHRNHQNHLKDEAGHSARITRSETDLTVLGDVPKKHFMKRQESNTNQRNNTSSFATSQNSPAQMDGSNDKNLYKQQNKSASSLTSSVSSNVSKVHISDKAKVEGKEKILEAMRLNFNKSKSYSTNGEGVCSALINSPSTLAHNTKVLGDTSSISSRYNHNGLLRRVTDIGSSIGLKTHKGAAQEDDFIADSNPHPTQLNKIVSWISNHSINHHVNPSSPKYRPENSDEVSMISNSNRNKHGIHFSKKVFKFGHDTQKKSPDDNISFKSMVSNFSTKSKEKKAKSD